MRPRVLLVVLLALLGLPAAAHAEDVVIESFDGTKLVASWFPAEGLRPGRTAPTVLMTHGWGLTRQAAESDQEDFGAIGRTTLTAAGYNVLTWDSRGFGQSGGTVTVDAPEFEGRDVQALLDWVAGRPEARLDGPGDPRAGMHGPSYAGGIQLVAAGLDRRIDAIAPAIAWHSLLTALYREELVKGGWGAALSGVGIPSAALLGVVGPAGVQTGATDPHVASAFRSGLTTGRLSAEDRAWFASRGPGGLVERIRVPTLLVQGTADTLFTPSEALRSARILARNGVPVKMVWFCGGHGACFTGGGEPGKVRGAVLAWFSRWLQGAADTDTGPGFEWLADDARWRSAARWPLAPADPLTARGDGRLVLTPGDAASGTAIAATPSPNAVTVPIPAPGAAREVVGEPRVSLSYSGTGTAADTWVFAQLVDRRRNLVLGNQVTPIAVRLDGSRRTASQLLEGVAAHVTPESDLALQVIGGTNVYGPVRSAGTVELSRIDVTLPTGDPSAITTAGDAGGARRACTGRRSVTLTVRGPRGQRLPRSRVRLFSGRTRLSTRRIRTVRSRSHRRVRLDLRGIRAGRVTVRISGRTRAGRRVTARRSLRTCVRRRR